MDTLEKNKALHRGLPVGAFPIEVEMVDRLRREEILLD